MNIQFRATIVCNRVDGDRECTEVEVYEACPESMSLEQFGDEATRYFRNCGWQFGMGMNGKCRCPGHAGV